jgi:hypothetical protein
MVRKSISIAIAASLAAALAGASTASAQKFGKLNSHLNKNQTLSHVDGSKPTFMRQPLDNPRKPQTKPPAWKPSFSEKADKLNDHLNKNSPLGYADNSNPTFMRQGSGYYYPRRPKKP